MNGMTRAHWSALRARYEHGKIEPFEELSLKWALELRALFAGIGVMGLISIPLFALSLVGCSWFTGFGPGGLTSYGFLVLILMFVAGLCAIATPVLWMWSHNDGVNAWNEMPASARRLP